MNNRSLLERLREGEADAFTEIYREYHDVLYIYAFRLLGNEDLAEDAVHELFLSMWERREQLSSEIALRPYLFQAIRFRSINLMQHDQVRERAANYFRQYLAFSSNEVADQMEEQELFEQLRTVVDRLPGKMSQVFWMRHDQVPDEEIADRLGISVKTVRNLMSKTVKKLRTRFRVFIFSFFV